MSTCQICNETLNKSNRKPIICILCEEPKPVCCFQCFSRVLLSSTVASCVFCKREISRDFIYEMATKSFLKELEENRFELQFSLEKSLLPETQNEAFVRKSLHALNRNMVRMENEKKILICRKKLYVDEVFFLKRDRKADIDEITKMQSEIRRIRNEINETQDGIRELIEKKYALRNNNKRKEQHFISACPLENCRGFLSAAHKCGTCNTYFCADCNEQKNARYDENHVCNTEMKATLDLIKKDSKPCPKCSILIYKVSGCPQMWCVKCHTAFNWNTGVIDTGYVHNPEYFRYLRETGQDIPRNPNDIVNGCQIRVPTITELRRGLGRMNPNIWIGWFDFYQHVRWYLLPNDARQFRDTDYSEYRIQYLNEEITLQEWRKILKMRIKKNDLMLERFMILDMYCNVMSDLFVNLSLDKNENTFTEGARQILRYTNTQMEKVNSKYSSKDTRYFLPETDARISNYFS